MNAIIVTLYCEALVLFVLIAVTAVSAKHDAAKHHTDALGRRAA
jgi:hypothetical protein